MQLKDCLGHSMSNQFTLSDIHYRLKRSEGVIISDVDANLVLKRIEIDYPKEGICWPNIDICYTRLLLENKLYKKLYYKFKKENKNEEDNNKT